VNPDGSTAVSGGGPEGPHAFDFDPTLLRIDLATGAADPIPSSDSGPAYEPQYIDDDHVVALVDGPEGLAGHDDNHLVAVDVASGTSTRVTPPDHQVISFGVLPCARRIMYVSSGELVGFDNQPMLELDLDDLQPMPLANQPSGREIEPHPSGTGYAYRDYDPRRVPGQVQYHWRDHAQAPSCA
jgi:hypothetical protein